MKMEKMGYIGKLVVDLKRTVGIGKVVGGEHIMKLNFVAEAG